MCHALVMAGKLMRRVWISVVAPGQLVHIVDESSHRRFLVDTGAAYSIFPFSSSGKQPGPRLTGADVLHIPFWEERRFPSSSMAADSSGRFCWPRSSFPSSGWLS